MKSHAPYDRNDVRDIVRHARTLIGTSLRKMYEHPATQRALEETKKNKGGFGQRLEELHFGIATNSRAEPDFAETGLELKATGIEVLSKKESRVKERVSLNSINFRTENWDDFNQSSFWKKNRHLLIVSYLYERGQDPLDAIWKHAGDWQYPEKDLGIIQEDWGIIANKVKTGRAHELTDSEGKYLSASPKGKNKEDTVEQIIDGAPRAKRRGYALRDSYVATIINRKFDSSLSLAESAIRSAKIIEEVGFEEAIILQFREHFGKSETQLRREFRVTAGGKAGHQYLAKAILGVSAKSDIDEFEKAGIKLKVITLKPNGVLKESMSFEQIDYREVAQENWEDSRAYEIFTGRYLFIVYRKNEAGDRVLVGCFFWTLPESLRDLAEEYWSNIQSEANESRYDHFWSMADDKVFHVRPKAQNSKDRTVGIDGKSAPKKCYWLNASYILSVVHEHLPELTRTA